MFESRCGYFPSGISGVADEILKRVREADSIEVEALARFFGVTTQTIRQDLRSLDEQGLLKRTHGGARRLDAVTTRDCAARRTYRGTQKQEIGRTAAALIPDGSSVILNIGTTTEQVAQALSDHSGLMVISNNINIIANLSGTNQKDLVLVGGHVRRSDGTDTRMGDDRRGFPVAPDKARPCDAQ